MTELNLTRAFPPVDEAEWTALVEKALKGAPLSALTSESRDGIVIEPFYPRASDHSVVAGRAAGRPWEVMQRIDSSERPASRQALEDLNNGASGLALVFEGSIGDYGYGLAPSEAAL